MAYQNQFSTEDKKGAEDQRFLINRASLIF
ncbi:hypothetical protein P872_03630 [Rhodonellum psychrophilum GCM71 = DSM 17998]|uniref:Uncharacterized protein n=1 Tax=Rhodonellum psychrophilum GCM71 = DSM 17998 TaxID=1123057 RepID=U5C082_9BACT|nr:hypothetical protein P872_03630 [Rhodonellum psychrophilum GCM71 = DSM 17998]